MKTYTISRVNGAPDWSAIPAVEIDQPHKGMHLTDTPVRAWAQLAHDDEAIYVHQWTTEPEIRAEYTGLLDEVCEDSCLEVYLCPVAGDERYFNIEYNPNGARYLGLGSRIENLVRLLPEENNDNFDPIITRTADGWEIFYRIPFAFIRRFFPEFFAASGTRVRGNFCKCGNFTATPHWLTWSPIAVQPLTFHYPPDFGTMIFE